MILWQLFWTFVKIGAFTIGGGYAMIPLIEREVVTRRGWISSDEFLDLLVAAQAAPGVLAINISVLVGNKIHGYSGAIVSALGSTLPSFVIILIFAMFLNKYQDSPLLEKMFRAVRPAVVALIAAPVFNLAKTAKITWRTAWIPVVAALLIWICGVSPIWIIAAAGGIGLLVYLIQKRVGKNEK
jgi:chromate transporter